MLAEIAAGVLVNVITATGRWIAASAVAGGGSKAARRDADIAAWFETYELVGNGFPELPGVPEGAVEFWLKRNDVHAVLHELLATRITDAPEADVERLRRAMRETAWAALQTVKVREPPTGGGPSGLDRRGWRLVHDVPPEFGLTRDGSDAIADLVFDWADGEICELVARFEARDPQRWRAARQDAFGARIVAVLHAIERHVAALDARPNTGADEAWVARYRRQAVQAYGSIEPPDFARRRKVPIGDLYVPPDIVEPGAARDADGNPRTIGFDDLVSRIDRTVLLGDPGGGKSTASQVLAHRWASETDARVPFLVVLRDFAGDRPSRSVVGHIEERLEAFFQCPAPGGTVERLLLTGDAAVIFDGLDELIDTGRRIEVTRVVEQFCERFPLAPVLVTSRLVGYDEARLDDALFDRYRTAGFTREKTAEYVRNWFALEDGAGEEDADAFMRESEQVTDLRENPLMLSLMCILYRGQGTLPRNRPAVYAECAKLLYDKWDTRRGIHVELRARNLIEPTLRHVAYWLFTRSGSPEVTERELAGQVADLLYGRGFEQRHDAEAAAGEFVEFCRGRAWILGDAGTTARGEPLYTFTHRTFLEYFTAAYLASVNDTPERLARALAPHIAKGEWDVVGQLAVQIKDAWTDRGAERVLTALLNDKRRRSHEAQMHLLAFAARCLDVAEVPPALVRDITNRAFDRPIENGDTALMYLPLWRDRIGEVMAQAIADRAAALMASDAPWAAARFSVYAAFCAVQNGKYEYWVRLERRLIMENRAALIKLACTDDQIWNRLTDRGVITLAEGLKLRSWRLDVLVRPSVTPIGRRIWPAYVVRALYLSSDRTRMLFSTPEIAMKQCRAFGEALPSLPNPPWDIALPEGLSMVNVVRERCPPAVNAEAEPVVASGAVVLLSILAEMKQVSFEPVADRAVIVRDYPGFDDLLKRAGTVVDWLPSYMDRWLRGELDFVQWRHDDEPG